MLGDPFPSVDIRWLKQHLSGAELRLVDVRQHDSRFIPGAVALEAGGPDDALELAAAMSRAGVGDDHTVIVYDEGRGAAAMRLAERLRRYGHSSVFVLEGGFRAWVDEGGPVAAEPGRHAPAPFTIRLAKPQAKARPRPSAPRARSERHRSAQGGPYRRNGARAADQRARQHRA